MKKINVFSCFSKRFCFLFLEKRSLVNSENVENPLVFAVRLELWKKTAMNCEVRLGRRFYKFWSKITINK